MLVIGCAYDLGCDVEFLRSLFGRKSMVGGVIG